jgi:hypothetical protein
MVSIFAYMCRLECAKMTAPLQRREAAARAEAEELRGRIAELTERLARAEERLSRLAEDAGLFALPARDSDGAGDAAKNGVNRGSSS